ncbi:MAG: DNA-3-methyladenine glycosylase family protein, partial [Gemmataceae bacterium]
MNCHSFVLQPVPPFRLDLTVWTLRRRPDNAVDRWDGRTYRRVLVLAGLLVEVAIMQIKPPGDPHLLVTVNGPPLTADVRAAVTSALERLLGLRIDLAEFRRFTARRPRLGALARRFWGMKPPRFPSVFEAALNAMACQQITLTLGIRLLNRLAASYGAAFQEGERTVHTFPQPEALAGLDPQALRELGFSYQKARAMIELADAITTNRLDLEALADKPDADALAQLRELRGIGRWTAEYILLRGLGRQHVFPGDDVGARKNLQRWLR